MRAARAAFVVVVVMATLAARPSVVEAQVILPEEAKLYRSPQHFGFELRFGPYRPNVDSEFNRADRHPYQTFFGSGSHLMTQLEFDYQFFRRMGSLAVGATVGYFSVSGTNPAKNGSGNTADSSNFQIIPFSVSAVYRFDYFFQERRFPLVPYGKLGLDYALWRVNDANDEIATDASGGRARGGVPGWHVAAGLSLVLDFIDPDGARSFDDELGVNHTHLFVEFSHADISGLGASNKIHLGDDTWMAGLLFEF
ncbi:MAG: hypothetical protein QOI66_3183 [Myxococcales bacterium]|nr:hypothetical protein [Myxococcales bacterium]